MLHIGSGLFVLGLTAYAFLAVSARVLGPERYAALSALWALVFLAGPGVFFPIEQEVSRVVASRHARGLRPGSIVRRAGAVAIGLAAAISVCAGASSRVLLREVFDDQVVLLIAFMLSLFGFATTHITRGVLAGSARFVRYALLLGAEGVLRLAVAGLLFAVGVRTAGPLGLVVGLAPFVAVAVALTGQRDLLDTSADDGEPAERLSRSIGYLLAGSLLTQVLIHAGPLAVKVLAGAGSQDLAGRFFTGVLLTRAPLFLYLAVLAALLPKLVGCATQGDRKGFSSALNGLLALTVAGGVVSVAGAFLVGPRALEVLFGPEYHLTGGDLALLAASSVAIMGAQALGQALVALEGQAAAAAGWLTGVICFGLALAFGDDPIQRVEFALLAGSLVATAATALALRSALARRLPWPLDARRTPVEGDRRR